MSTAVRDWGVFLLHVGDCRTVLAALAEASVDSVVCDPPYELTAARPGGRSEATRGAVMGGFMGMAWDGTGVAFDVDVWRQAFRVLKPGGHLLAFSGTRTQHRMVCAIEDAGFEIRDQAMWVYGSGFPKSLDVSKAIDKAAGAEREVISSGRPVKRMIPGADQNASGSWIKDNGREFVPTETAPATDAAHQWEGWGTALKPAWEPICVARKPLVGTVAANVLAHGTGALNIDGCRVDAHDGATTARKPPMVNDTAAGFGKGRAMGGNGSDLGRWPANLIHDGSDEVVALFPQAAGQLAAASSSDTLRAGQNVYGVMRRGPTAAAPRVDSSTSAARFFYCAKASRTDRGEGNTHPTVKPTDLMRYLCRLVTPPGGTVLDPFAGSGSTGKAAVLEGFTFVGVELSEEYALLAERRIAAAVFGVAAHGVAA